mmetsp:Transcript_79813/g.231673  ORF Transcript_79813/g.231673 Transcript_79813/m.231673 type:complete len:274 (-) Transcript_79813:662-1483(-)
MRRLGEVVPMAAGPHENVVGQVPDRVPSLLLWAGQRLADGRDVLVVPSVAIGEGCAPRDAGDLVAVIPPSHDASVLRGVLVDPLIPLQVVVDHNLAAGVAVAVVEDDLRVGERLRHVVAMLHKLVHLRDRAAEEDGVQNHRDRQGGTDGDALKAVVLHVVRRVEAGDVLGDSLDPTFRQHAVQLHRSSRPKLLLPLFGNKGRLLLGRRFLRRLGQLAAVLCFAALVLRGLSAVGRLRRWGRRAAVRILANVCLLLQSLGDVRAPPQEEEERLH